VGCGVFWSVSRGAAGASPSRLSGAGAVTTPSRLCDTVAPVSRNAAARAKTDLISVVEASYDLKGSEEDWLRGIAASVRPALDRGFGIVAVTFQCPPSARRLASLDSVVIDGPPWLAAAHAAFWSSHRGPARKRAILPKLTHLTYRHVVGYAALSEIIERSDVPDTFSVDPYASRYGYRDFLALQGREPGGLGVNIGALVPERIRTVSTDRARFLRVAAHLSAGLRLRRALAAGGGAEEAFLRADGACLHAVAAAQSTSARERLRAAAKAIDRARGRLRRSNEAEALDLWRGLCAGRWSLVDRFDSDGRRFVVARRNPPEVQDPRDLTLRERQIVGYAALGWSNKLIAYALGLSLSAVAFHLASSERKLGVLSRTGLIELASRLGTPRGEMSDS
jgi:DNA-binding CsgD family transcriptional regulator